MKTLLVMLLLAPSIVLCASYYVDYDSGNNANKGTTPASPWRHCPGDPNATGVAAATVPGPGDIVYFKGGVVYRGRIIVKGGGSTSAPVTYDGSPGGWGSGKAIIDGTIKLTWTRCTAEGSGTSEVLNSNFANIYYATLPGGADWQIPVFEGNQWLVRSGTQNQVDPWHYNNTDYFQSSQGGVTSTSTKSTTYFNQSDSNYWKSAIMMVHISGNAIGYQAITGFDPNTSTVSYSDIGVPYRDQNWDNGYHFSVINGQRQISGPGQYAVDIASRRILVWPYTNVALLSVGSEPYCFNTNAKSYVTIRNFVLQGTYGASYEAGRLITGNSSVPTNGVRIEQCTLRNAVGGGATAAIYTFGAGNSPNIVSNNNLSRIYGRGIFGTGSNFIFQSNEISYVTGTAMYSQNHPTVGNTNGQYLDNYIHDCGAVHANGMTIYGGAVNPSAVASDFVVARNRVIRQNHRYGPFAVSLQGHRNIRFVNNVLDGNIADDGAVPGSDYIEWYNNTINGNLRILGAENSKRCVVRNNIITAGILNNTNESWSGIERSYNIYATPSWRQRSEYGWTLGTGERVNLSVSSLFLNYSSLDFRISSTSVAYGAGVDLGLEVAQLISSSGPIIGAWSIGAYQGYDSSAALPSAPSSLILTPKP